MNTKRSYIKLIFGLKLRQIRQEKGLSLSELANKSSLSISYLNEIENGKKYPKAEKISQLAKALDVDYDDLVSLKLTKNLRPIAELIDSNILEMLPLDHYGIDLNKFISLMSSASYQLSALVATVIEMAKSTELSQNNFSRTAFRIYKEFRNNYLEEIEQSVLKFIDDFKIDTTPPLNYKKLFEILEKKFNYILDETSLDNFEELRQLRGFLKTGKKPVLFLNPRLSSAQKLFIIGKELGYNFLRISNRTYIHSNLKLNNFDHLLNNYFASYFSTALILNRNYFIESCNSLFSKDKWDDNGIINLINKYDATPEMFFQRLANLAYHIWGLKRYFFLRFSSYAETDEYYLTKELRLNINQNLGGYQTNEHYCRRWISISLLKDIKAESSCLISGNKMKAGIIHSKFYGTLDEYISFSVAQKNILDPNIFTTVTLGFYLDNQTKKTFKFWNDPKIPFRIVNETCEMCDIADCKERVAEPIFLTRIQKLSNIEKAIKKL